MFGKRPQQREQNPANSVSERDDDDTQDRFRAPRARHPEIKHIRDAVLRSGEVEPHDAEKQGQILAIVEAMKLMNDIESEYEGEIAEIYVENGQSVEYGQPLFRII